MRRGFALAVAGMVAAPLAAHAQVPDAAAKANAGRRVARADQVPADRAAASAALVAEPAAPRPGSLVTATPLGPGNIGMRVGGGVAVLLPFYGFEVGVGLAERVDLVGGFESVVGVLHYPRLGVRYSPFEIGTWRVGTTFSTHYSFFGIATDQVNLTSTFYLSAEASLSGPITAKTELCFAAGAEVDVFEYDVFDGEGELRGSGRYDATNLRLALRTPFTDELDGYLAGRVRIPVETFTYEATSFYVIPLIEIGGSWAF
jgi:hypothetical protein